MLQEDNYWHNTQTAQELITERISLIEVDGKKVNLTKKDGNIYAFAEKCPHAGAPLCDGWQDAMGRIVCPLHKYRFDPANGRNTSGEGYKLFTYPVQIRDGIIWIGFLN